MSNLGDELPLGGALVGGSSRRFGSDKAVATIGDRSLAARAVDTLRAASDPVGLLGGDGTLARRLGLPWRPDSQPGCGPLGGLATGLAWAAELGRPGLLVLACDLPLAPGELLRAIVDASGPDVDAVVATTPDGPGIQPLCGWYATGVLPAVEGALAAGRHSMMRLLDGLRVERVPAEEGLLNVNTPHDLATARRHAPALDER